MKVADEEGIDPFYFEQNSYKTEIAFLAKTKVKLNKILVYFFVRQSAWDILKT